jgi:hypothetical protein
MEAKQAEKEATIVEIVEKGTETTASAQEKQQQQQEK